MYQDPAGELTNEDEFNYNASTNTLAVENITGTTVTGTGVVKGSNTFGQRYATQAATNRAAADTASLTVERYFTVTAEGNGESFNIQSDTPSAGNKIVRKIWYKDEAFEDSDVDTWTLLHTFADDATYASTATKWQEYLDGQSNGTPPFTLAISWEDIPALVGILDNYTADLEGAYALALLDSTYTGDCIRVRRASDNTEQDIGFDDQDLDTTALTTFCTGTDCFIKTLYDQSGNANDATQATTNKQPKIYDAATGVELENSLPALNYTGVEILQSATLSLLAQPTTRISIGTTASPLSNFGEGFQDGSVSNRQQVGYETNGNWRLFAGSVANAPTGPSAGTTYLMHALFDGVNTSLHVNSNFVYSANVGNHGLDQISLGGGLTSSFGRVSGKMQAAIIYSADKSADRTAIETALNDYFNVY
jgi:hypothetical protein